MIKLTNLWSNYMEIISRIQKVDSTFFESLEYSVLMDIKANGKLGTGLSFELIIELLTSSDILGEFGEYVFDYSKEDLLQIIEVLNTQPELILEKIESENSGTLFNGNGMKWRYSNEIIVDTRYELKRSRFAQKAQIASHLLDWLNKSGSSCKVNAVNANRWYNSLTGRNFNNGRSIGKYQDTLVIELPNNIYLYISDSSIKFNGEFVETKAEFKKIFETIYIIN